MEPRDAGRREVGGAQDVEGEVEPPRDAAHPGTGDTRDTKRLWQHTGHLVIYRGDQRRCLCTCTMWPLVDMWFFNIPGDCRLHEGGDSVCLSPWSSLSAEHRAQHLSDRRDLLSKLTNTFTRAMVRWGRDSRDSG